MLQLPFSRQEKVLFLVLLCLSSLLGLAVAEQPSVPPQKLQPGLHAAGDSDTVRNRFGEELQTVRFMLDIHNLEAILLDPQTQAEFEQSLSNYVLHGTQELIASVRVPDPGDAEGKHDYIPPIVCQGSFDADCYAGVLAILREFCRRYAHVIDLQLGNEYLGGPGQYDFSQNPFPDVIAWFEDQAEWAEAGAALNPNSQQFDLISPALTAGDIEEAASNAQPRKFRVLETIRLANREGMLLDQHLHEFDSATTADTLAKLYGLEEIPQAATCLEWSPSRSARAWLADPDDNYQNFRTWDFIYANATSGVHLSPQAYSDFINGWLADQNLDLTAYMPAALAAMNGYGFRHACYASPWQQDKGSDYFFNLAKLRANLIAQPDFWVPAFTDPLQQAMIAYL